MTTFSASFPVLPAQVPPYRSILIEIHEGRTARLRESEFGKTILASGDVVLDEIDGLLQTLDLHTEPGPVKAEMNQMDYTLAMSIKEVIARRLATSDLDDAEGEALRRLERAIGPPQMASRNSFSAR